MSISLRSTILNRSIMDMIRIFAADALYHSAENILLDSSVATPQLPFLHYDNSLLRYYFHYPRKEEKLNKMPYSFMIIKNIAE